MKRLIILISAISVTVTLAMAIDYDKQEELTYNEALVQCSNISNINQRNYCRMRVTEKYRDK